MAIIKVISDSGEITLDVPIRYDFTGIDFLRECIRNAHNLDGENIEVPYAIEFEEYMINLDRYTVEDMDSIEYLIDRLNEKFNDLEDIKMDGNIKSDCGCGGCTCGRKT